MPKISVCLPTFNRVNLLPYAIESALKQTYQDFELIICDDGSQDSTSTLMSEYTDSRIKYIRHPHNIGKSNNMQSGFDAATGDYFIKFDDDDRLTPEFLSRTAAILDRDSSIDFVGTDHWIIDIDNLRDETRTQENSRSWGREDLPEGVVDNLLEVVFVKQSFQIGATLFRRATLQEVGFMQRQLQNCEDSDLFVRLALAGKKGYYFPELLMEYRFHEQQQGIDRAIQYLSDKIESEELERVRIERLVETQLLLGLRLVETGETQKGRELLWAGKCFSKGKAYVGLALSGLPVGLRPWVFDLSRRIRG
jgi:glycosyltransferase involved in cell wall biosynthesis